MDKNYNQLENMINKTIPVVHNYNITDNEITNLGISELANIKDSWFIDKQFQIKSGFNLDKNIDFNIYYKGHIKDYTMIKRSKNGIDFFYIKLNCVVLIDLGIYTFEYTLPVSFYNNSNLTKLLYELNFNVDTITSFNFDDLKGKLVFVKLKQSDSSGIVIDEMKIRNI